MIRLAYHFVLVCCVLALLAITTAGVLEPVHRPLKWTPDLMIGYIGLAICTAICLFGLLYLSYDH